MAVLPCCTPQPTCTPYQGFSYLDFCNNSCSTSTTITAYANDAAAGAAGVTTGKLWKTSSSNTLGLPENVVMVKA